MKQVEVLTHRKDGGPESRVWGYWLIAVRQLFSIILLRFEDGSREAYHSHAFNCVSWVLKGHLTEYVVDWYDEDTLGGQVVEHKASWKPFITKRTTFHKVSSKGTSWVLTFRGPWARTWKEYIVATKQERVLTWGRKEV